MGKRKGLIAKTPSRQERQGFCGRSTRCAVVGGQPLVTNPKAWRPWRLGVFGDQENPARPSGSLPRDAGPCLLRCSLPDGYGFVGAGGGAGVGGSVAGAFTFARAD